jgi:hypothetical protein
MIKSLTEIFLVRNLNRLNVTPFCVLLILPPLSPDHRDRARGIGYDFRRGTADQQSFQAADAFAAHKNPVEFPFLCFLNDNVGGNIARLEDRFDFDAFFVEKRF